MDKDFVPKCECGTTIGLYFSEKYICPSCLGKTLVGQAVENTIKRVKDDCIKRLREVRGVLDSVEERLTEDDPGLCDLGELQAAATIFDCRIAALATLLRLQKLSNEKTKEQS